MCGISGCFQQVNGEGLVRIMNDRTSHRGPDDEGLFTYQSGDLSVQLAHRRLSIIDLSENGHQPFTRDGLTLCYNGELYNYRELRSQLAGEGVRFTSESDTEVLLEAWRRWGPAALNKLRGMFALAIFDERTGRLVLARDPLGIKPLYYLPRAGGVVFCSELKGIVSALGRGLVADPGALVASVLFYWVPPERCAIQGVEKVPPGSWIEFRPDGERRLTRYWKVEEVAAEAAAGDPQALRNVIEDAVATHLVADVPVSTFLSGGLDSSIITVLAQRSNPQIDAYTITFRDTDRRLEAMPDDAVYARKLAHQFGINLHEIEVAPDIVDLLPKTVDMLDEPIGDPAAINTLLMCEAARAAGVKVILSGMGADELFAGYRKHVACTLASQFRRVPSFARRGIRGVVDRAPVVVAGRGLRHVRWAKRFLTFAELPEVEGFRRSYTLYDVSSLNRLLSPDLAGHVDDVIAEHDAIYADTTLTDPINRMCLADTRLFLPGLNLAYTDRASMAASVEVRVPFVDPEVVRAAFSIPGKDKIHGRTSKVALKEAAREWLPAEIIDRPKMSFSAPLRAWVSRDLRPLVDDELLGGDLVGSGFLQREALEQLVRDDRTGRADNAKQIWQLLSLELWSRQARSAGVAV
jgi:asparagine synthase (glutamine-hydrolysing)